MRIPSNGLSLSPRFDGRYLNEPEVKKLQEAHALVLEWGLKEDPSDSKYPGTSTSGEMS